MLNTNKLDKSGGKITGELSIGDFLKLWSDNEGGNIDIFPPSSIGGRWCIDAYDGNIRLFHYNSSGTIDCIYALKIDGTFNGKIPWSNVTDKPSTYPPSNHNHDYLPLSGGTLSGHLTMAASVTETADVQFSRPTNYNYDCHLDVNGDVFRIYRYDKSNNYKQVFSIKLETGEMTPATALSLSNGGTGATTAATARANLGLGSAATRNVLGQVLSGSTDLVSSDAVATALDGRISGRIKLANPAYDSSTGKHTVDLYIDSTYCGKLSTV